MKYIAFIILLYFPVFIICDVYYVYFLYV